MTASTTRTSLGIFWTGEEVDGILVYGLWSGDRKRPPSFPYVVWTGAVEVENTKLVGQNWTVWMWEVRVLSWPENDRWEEVIHRTLHSVIAGGGRVAWCGLEGMFIEPPSLFDPHEMTGGVWAALIADGKFYRPPPLEAQFLTLDDSALIELKKHVDKTIA